MSTLIGEEKLFLKKNSPVDSSFGGPDGVSCMSQQQHVTRASLLTALRRLRTEQIQFATEAIMWRKDVLKKKSVSEPQLSPTVNLPAWCKLFIIVGYVFYRNTMMTNT